MASICSETHNNHEMENLCEYLCVVSVGELGCCSLSCCKSRRDDWFPLRPIKLRHGVSSSDGDVGEWMHREENSQDAS